LVDALDLAVPRIDKRAGVAPSRLPVQQPGPALTPSASPLPGQAPLSAQQAEMAPIFDTPIPPPPVAEAVQPVSVPIHPEAPVSFIPTQVLEPVGPKQNVTDLPAESVGATQSQLPLAPARKKSLPIWAWVGGIVVIGLILFVGFILGGGGKGFFGLFASSATPTLPPATATVQPTETQTVQPTDTAVPTDTLVPTDTPAPTDTSTVSPTPPDLKAVVSQNAFVRSGPGLVYPRTGTVEVGAILDVQGRSSDSKWLYIVLPDKTSAWIALSVVTIDFDVSILPEVANPPTPTEVDTEVPATQEPYSPPKPGGPTPTPAKTSTMGPTVPVSPTP